MLRGGCIKLKHYFEKPFMLLGQLAMFALQIRYLHAHPSARIINDFLSVVAKPAKSANKSVWFQFEFESWIHKRLQIMY